MELQPRDWPRLSGKVCYDQTMCPWKIVDTERTIEIVPERLRRGVLIGFATLAALTVAGVGVAVLMFPNIESRGLVLVCGIGTGLSLLICGVLVHVISSRDFARGPILVISFAAKEVRLPREKKSWPFERIVRWEIVYGPWVQGEDGKPHLFDSVSELQMIVANETGGTSAWPIVGRGTVDELRAAAGTITRRMNLPLNVLIDQASGTGNIVLGSPEYRRSS